MRIRRFVRSFSILSLLALVLAPTASPVLGFGENQHPSRFDNLIKTRDGGVIGSSNIALVDLEPTDMLRQDWEGFITEQNGGWKVWIDPRTAAPTLVQGKGIAWGPGRGNRLDGPPATLGTLADRARAFMEQRPNLFGRWGDQLVLDGEASIRINDRVAKIAFKQMIDGVAVEGARYEFYVTHGNMVMFGARRWAPVRVSGEPSLSVDLARTKLDEYLGLESRDGIVDFDSGTLRIVPLDPAAAAGGAWDGPRGEGLDHKLVWRFAFGEVEGSQEWVGEIDAHTGQIVAFYDNTRYEQARGHVNPISDDGDCPAGGCLEAGYPMPFTDISEDGGPDSYAGDGGLFTCTLGSTVETNLDGQYMWINDVCGPVSESAVCDDELDLGGSTSGVNCATANGSAGNTDASRSAYYSATRINQKARFWMGPLSWLTTSFQVRTNVNATCNATYGGGRINMYRAGNGCGNTGQNQGVVDHEWGHGMDDNDGGGFDNPSEAYADVAAIFEARDGCVGRGFFNDGRTCSGYGDTCLTCTGIRDHNFERRTQNTPATPANFTQPNCGGGGGPCGRAVHCESYVPSGSVHDLAYRELPAAGFDIDTSWQLTERLWFASRPGSGGDVISCSLPNADSCASGSWMQQMRVEDDDDGNLANGTPHAAEIFAAFDLHEVACGNASDPENQNSSSCPTLATPVVTTKALTNAVELSWSAITDANGYRIYRNEIGCSRGQFPIAEVDSATLTYLDDDLINDFNVHYRVQAIGANTACESAVSACMTTAPQPLAGRIKFDRATYGCSNVINLRVTDANHSSGSMTVSIWSDTEATAESVLLTETAPGSSKFLGSIMTTADTPAADGLLSIADGDTITAEYIDEDDGAGNFNVSVQSSSLGDCVFPVITNVREENVNGSSATVAWDTNEISDTVLNWGETTALGNTDTGDNRTTTHSVQLGGLEECTVYYYTVESTDPAGNTAFDDNGGVLFRFETLGDLGQGLQPCHAGQVSVLADVHSCMDTVNFELTDIDLNADPLVAETAVIAITSTTEPTEEVLVLTETGPNTSVFAGSITTALGPPQPDGVLQTSDGDLMTATYRDADDGAGFPAISFDTAALDCGGPAISALNVASITNARSTLTFNTDEPGDTVILWGTTPALGQVASSGALVTGHSMLLNQFETCQQIWFRVQSTDVHGNTSVADDNGQPFTFSSNDIPGLYMLESFESGPGGWSLEGEWEIGTPQGIGGSSGPADPTGPYNNNASLGHDLAGQGSFGGDYEPNTHEKARSPVYDGSSWTNTKLIYYRRLNAGSGDNASAWGFTDGTGRPLFLSNGDPVTETSFSIQAVDISAFGDGAQVEIEFQQSANASGQHSGWNVDDIILKDGSVPDYAPCGSCGVAPSFAGATSAQDNNACGADGVTVSWAAAPAWGSGGPGTYALYRDLNAGFTPGAANLVASGLTGLAYNDLGAPTDQTVHYLVRAENDETCGAGPNNGGATDSNVAYVQVSETTSQATPGEVSGLLVDQVASTHVRLSWSATASATSYRIYRATSPEPENFGLLAEVSGTTFDDIGEAANSNSYYYKVTGVNACGDEGP